MIDRAMNFLAAVVIGGLIAAGLAGLVLLCLAFAGAEISGMFLFIEIQEFIHNPQLPSIPDLLDKIPEIPNIFDKLPWG